MSEVTVKRPQEIPLRLHRISESFRPYVLGDYELGDIHVFDKNGIRYSAGRGFFNATREEAFIEGDRHWVESMDGPMSIDFKMGCRRKIRPDFSSKVAFFIPKTKNLLRQRYDRKIAELYIPYDSFTWTDLPDFRYFQFEDTRSFSDLRGIAELGVGFLVHSRQIPYPQEKALSEAREKNLSGMQFVIKGIITNYLAQEDAYKKSKKELEEKIEQLRKLESPYWIDCILKPIAELMIKEPEFEDYDRYEIMGPFGIAATTSIHFYRKGVTNREELYAGGNIRSLTFVPADLHKARILLVDENANTKEFKDDTIAAMNGMNHPKLVMPGSIRELVKWAIH